MIVRPPEFLDDVRERELEMQAAEAALAQLDYQLLPALRLRGRARLPALPELPAPAQGARAPSCGKPLDPRWRICPYCEAEVARAERASRAAAAGAAPAHDSAKQAAAAEVRERPPSSQAAPSSRQCVSCRERRTDVGGARARPLAIDARRLERPLTAEPATTTDD